MNIKSILFILLIIVCFQNAFSQEKIKKTNSEWKKILTNEQYQVLRNKGTEYAFTGKYDKFYKSGVYKCAACNTPLFKSTSKFNSGTGWPSFDNHINNNVGFHEDNKYGMTRTEIVCNVCDGHLGHLFLDGPNNTTGKRYCVNSLSLNFEEKSKSKDIKKKN